MTDRVLLTGGSGRLGRHLRRLCPDWISPTHADFDVLNPEQDYRPTLIVHAAAYTHLPNAETHDQAACRELNVEGTRRLMARYPGVPFVFVNTEYALNPTNHYARTKYEAAQLVRADDRPTFDLYPPFWANPFPHPAACTDMYTLGDYVDVMAPKIVGVIEAWSRDSKMVCHLGTGRKTLYNLARRTNPDIQPCRVADIKTAKLPADYLGETRTLLFGTEDGEKCRRQT